MTPVPQPSNRRSTANTRGPIADALAAVAEVLGLAGEVLSPAAVPSDLRVSSLPEAARALRAVWTTVEDELRSDQGHRITADELGLLVLSLRGADEVLRKTEIERLSRQVSAVQDALARLDGVESVEQLWTECSRAVSQLDFDRGLFSLVNDAVWTPESAHSARESTWTRELLTAGRNSPRKVEPQLPEFALVRRQRAILVPDVQKVPHVYEEMVGASKSESYVAARIVADGQLVGFIHGDKYFRRQDVDEVDCKLLGIFAEAFGHVLSRAMLAERSAGVQAQLHSLAAGIQDAADVLHWPRQGTAARSPLPPSPGHAPGRPVAPHGDYGLTPREIQILEFLASGADNASIARSLYIANDTVKSHVKHILRKLGAASRAEAVARWFSGRADA